MKLYKSIIAGLICASAFVTSAQATPVAVSTTYTPASPKVINVASPYDFLLNIGSVFHAGTDVLNSGTITFSLDDPNKDSERVIFTFGISLIDLNGVQTFTINGNNNVNNGGTTSAVVTLNSASISDLAADGMLAVRLGAIDGAYEFLNARFDGMIEQGGRVPEPVSLALMGIGLAGIAALRARKST